MQQTLRIILAAWMQWLESLAGRDAVLKLLGDSPLTFTDYPHEPEYILELRERINAEIDRYTTESKR